MTRFFFDVVDGDKWLIDEEGSVFLDRELACRELVAVLFEVVSDTRPSATARLVKGSVREDGHEAFFTSSVELKSAWLDGQTNEGSEQR